MLETPGGIDGQSAEMLQTIIENIPDAVAIADTNAQFTVYNSAAAKLLNIGDASEPAGDCSTRYGVYLSDGVTPCPVEELPLLRALRGESTAGTVLTIRNRLHPDGVYVSSNARPLRSPDGKISGAILVCHDVSDLRAAEIERTRTLASLQFLSEASAILGRSLNFKDSLTRLATLAVDDFAGLCTCGLLEDDVFEIVARGVKGRGQVPDPPVRFPIASLPADHPVATCLRTGKPLAVPGIARRSNWAGSVAITSAQRDFLQTLTLDYYVLAPIAIRSRVFGVLSFGFEDVESGRGETEALAFAAEVGRRVGAAIENALLHQAVSDSEARYRVLSETMPQLVWSCRPDGYTVYLSPQWAEFTGVPVDQHLGWSWNQALHPEDQAKALSEWNQAAAGVSKYDIEYRMRRFDGTYRWFKARGTPLIGADGAVVQWFGTCTDIDDQKKAQQAEQESRERLNAALTASGTGTFRWNILTNELDWDENLDRLFGLPPGQSARALGQFVAMVHPGDRADVLERCARCAADGVDFEMEFRVIWPDGTVHWLYDRGKTFLEDGKPAYMTGACVDITVRVEAEQMQRGNDRLVRELLEAMPQMVWTTDFDGNVEYLNSRWISYTGFDVEDVRKLGWRIIFHPDDLEKTGELWLQAVATGEPYQAEHRMRSAAGEYRWFLTRGVRLRNAQQETMRWFGTSTDITEQKLAEGERSRLLSREQDARAQAESAAAALAAVNEELQHFVYAASHDLQAPLRTMAMYSELLMRRLGPGASESTTVLLDFIKSNAQRLSRLLSELLAYTSIGNDPVPLTESVDVGTVLDTVLTGLGPLLETSGTEVTVDPLPHITGSSSQIAELLQNLITNAVKYSRPGVSPRIHISAANTEPLSRFSVRDNGQGFDPTYSETIFEVFKRLHGSSVEGTGIGLALCRRIVERHGGTIWAESVPGQGSTFHFTLPGAGHSAVAGQ